MQKCVKYKSTYKRCTSCNYICQTLANEPYCTFCIRKKCELRHLKIPLNRCNNVLDHIERDNRIMCIGHYKHLQKHCKVCGVPKLKNDTLSYDDWYYCTSHKPKHNEQKYIVARLLHNVLDDDCISHICKFL